MAASDEKICNEIICKLQKLTTLLGNVCDSTESISVFLSTHTEGETSAGLRTTKEKTSGLITETHKDAEEPAITTTTTTTAVNPASTAVKGLDTGASFGVNSSNIKNNLLAISSSLEKISKRLKAEMEPGLVSDLEANDLEYSDRLHLLYYASDYTPLPEIIAAFVLRFLPDITPLVTAISEGRLASVPINAFTADNDDLPTDALSLAASNEVECKQLLKEVDYILVSHASDALQYCLYVSNTFSVVDRLMQAHQ